MNRAWLLGGLWAALFSAACSDSADSARGAPGLVRLAVLPTDAEPRPSEWVRTGTVDWPVDLAGVGAVGARLEARQRTAGRNSPVLLVLREEGAESFPELVTVKLAGRFDTTTFNRLRIPIESARDAYVHCTLRSRGVPLLGSTNRARIEPQAVRGGPTVVALDLPGARELASVPDELELVFDNVRGPLRLGAIELLQHPIWAWLPAAEDGFGLVSLGHDARNAVGLSTERSLEAELVVPSSAELRCAVGIPRPLRLGGTRPFFRVEVHAPGEKPLVQRLRLESDLTVESQWHKVRVPLDGFSGKRVRIVFAFAVGGPREAVCALTRPRVETGKAAPRTVLLVTSDTHRADALGAASIPGDLGAPGSAGNPGIDTPTLDALARRGVLFEDCWAVTNVTLPSHVSIMTATSPRDSGVLDNFTRLSRRARTLAEEFQDAGFATYAVVSAPHLSDAASGLGQGFDRMSAPTSVNKLRSEKSIARLLAWIDDAEGQDLFLWLHTFDAHTPYEPPPEFERRYYPAGRDPFDPALPEPRVPDVFRVNLPAGLRDLELLSARYRGEVSYLDRELAALFAVPRVQGGIVAVTADHGESLGEHGIFWEHAGLYPQSIHVPLILVWPDAPAGTRVREPVSHLDLGRTLLSLADVAAPGFPGASLRDTTRSAAAPRFTIASAADRASITQGGWHLIVALRGYFGTVGDQQVPLPEHRVELYDLATDPRCERDLARSELDRACELRMLLCNWLATANPTGWAEQGAVDPETRERLAQLGYAASDASLTFRPIEPDCPCEECAPFRVAR